MYRANQSIAPRLAQPDTRDPGTPSACPSGITTNGAYGCIDAYKDNAGKGHRVIIRTGKSGSSGFGYLHALIDHNLDLHVVHAVIGNAAAGVSQGSGKYLYGAFHEAPKGEVDQFVEIVDNRNTSKSSGDLFELGLQTGYCKDGHYHTENKCPDWVNDAL